MRAIGFCPFRARKIPMMICSLWLAEPAWVLCWGRCCFLFARGSLQGHRINDGNGMPNSKNLPGTSQTQANQPFGKNTQASTDYQNLTTALKSDDLQGAQKAFTGLQTDLKATHKCHHH